MSFSSNTLPLLYFLVVISIVRYCKLTLLIDKNFIYCMKGWKAVYHGRGKKIAMETRDYILYKYFFCCHLVVHVLKQRWHSLCRRAQSTKLKPPILFASHLTPRGKARKKTFTLKIVPLSQNHKYTHKIKDHTKEKNPDTCGYNHPYLHMNRLYLCDTSYDIPPYPKSNFFLTSLLGLVKFLIKATNGTLRSQTPLPVAIVIL